MIPLDRLVLLDTSVVVHIARDNALGQRISREQQLVERKVRPLLSIISVGELLAFARKLNWGDKKTEALRSLMRELTVVDIRAQGLLDRYAEIVAVSEAGGRKMGDNDAWIAATAAAAGATLLTNDKDFDHLHPTHIERLWIDPHR